MAEIIIEKKWLLENRGAAGCFNYTVYGIAIQRFLVDLPIYSIKLPIPSLGCYLRFFVVLALLVACVFVNS